MDATRNMGDYKLKSEKGYVPGENKRMTPKRKKQQVQPTVFQLRANICIQLSDGFSCDSNAVCCLATPSKQSSTLCTVITNPYSGHLHESSHTIE